MNFQLNDILSRFFLLLNQGNFSFISQDFRLLFHKCALLHSQNRIDEFLEAGIDMFRLFFVDVYYIKDLVGLCSDAICSIEQKICVLHVRKFGHLWTVSWYQR